MLAEHKLPVVKWGNSLAVRLPSALVAELKVIEGQLLHLAAGPAGSATDAQSAKPGMAGFAEEAQAPFMVESTADKPALSATVGKWGNSLAVRLPRALLDGLGLQEGDQVTINKRDTDMVDVMLDVTKEAGVQELFARLRAIRQDFPADYCFDRDAANSRHADDRG